MKKSFFFLFISLLLTVGCSTPATQNYSNNNVHINFDMPLKITSEVTRGDFVYRLISEKDIYENGEDVKLFAELEYVGAESSVLISHSASPFWFTILEKTRNYSLGYMMNEPLIHTKIEKGQPLREQYKSSVFFNPENDVAYARFEKELTNNGFPKGEYLVNGKAEFHYIINETTGEKLYFDLITSLEFKVTD